MTLRTLKRKCEQIQEGVPGLLQQLQEKYNSRSERWQKSSRGRDLRTDIRMLRELSGAVSTYIGGSQEEE